MALCNFSKEILQALDVPALPNCCAAAFATPLIWVWLIQVMKNTLLTFASFLHVVRAGLGFSPRSLEFGSLVSSVFARKALRKTLSGESVVGPRAFWECAFYEVLEITNVQVTKVRGKTVLREKFKVILLLDFNLVWFHVHVLPSLHRLPFRGAAFQCMF